MDKQLTDEQILKIADSVELPYTIGEPSDGDMYLTWPDRVVLFARALLSQQVEAAKTSTEVSPYDKIAALMPDGSAASNVYEAFECGRRAALEEAAKLCESLVAESGVHSNFACAMKIRALSSPAEQKEGNV